MSQIVIESYFRKNIVFVLKDNDCLNLLLFKNKAVNISANTTILKSR